MRSAEELAGMMAVSQVSPEIQLSQTRFRMEVVDQWKIFEGARVLEIGCGQGDTTAVLADAVGHSGKVTAVDNAKPSYGAPVTVGDSARHLSSGPLGDRIEFRFEFDAFDPANDFDPDAFDCVVLAHSSWYFASIDQLRETFRIVRRWAPRLCFSEWDPEPQAIEQIGHLLAVWVQGQVAAFNSPNESNVRTPASRSQVKKALEETGWILDSETQVDSSDLADGNWEIWAAQSIVPHAATSLGLPPRMVTLLDGQIDLLRSIAAHQKNRSLSSYAIVASRSD